ncbi:MAG: MoaD/ThiS family protein [Candidatus Wallbacteria bacterium]|nr:MoaD/ThiS family protein [Candidatus Wallbacteria bacterium]
MKITVEFVGAIDSGPYERMHEFEIDSGASAGAFLAGLHFHSRQVEFIQVVRDGKRLNHSAELQDGDNIQLMIPVGGG